MSRFCIFLLLLPIISKAQFAPPANQVGTTAIHKDSSVIVNWANGVVSFQPGPQNVSVGNLPLASFGDSTAAIGYAEGNSTNVVSLGDGGSITLSFEFPIKNGAGPDFLVFENGFDHTFLELAHVEVSTNGVDFVRIPSTSNVSTSSQTNGFAPTDATLIHNLAGKYIQGYGTPFDLEDVIDSVEIDLNQINYVRVIDVVGSIDPSYGSFDAYGNIINDPFPTQFESGGFDLDAVGVIHQNVLPVSIEESVNDVLIYPNPTTDEVYIKSTAEIGDYCITDLSGRIVYEGVLIAGAALNLIDLGCSPGVYLFHFAGNAQKIMLR